MGKYHLCFLQKMVKCSVLCSLSLQLVRPLYESFLSAVSVFIVSICQHESRAAEEMKPHDISVGEQPIKSSHSSSSLERERETASCIHLSLRLGDVETVVRYFLFSFFLE